MVGCRWRARRIVCRARILRRAGSPSSRTGSTGRTPSSRTPTLSWRISARPSGRTWGTSSGWRCTAWPTATASTASCPPTSCGGTFRLSWHSPLTSPQAACRTRCSRPSRRRTRCSSPQVCLSGLLELASPWRRSVLPTSSSRIVGTAGASSQTREQLRTSPTITTLRLRVPGRSSGCSTAGAPSRQIIGSHCQEPRAGSRQRGPWGTIGRSRRGPQKSMSSRAFRRSERSSDSPVSSISSWPRTASSASCPRRTSSPCASPPRPRSPRRPRSRAWRTPCSARP
mmetsp:Transcript_6716/g.18329  ORF Transcript_6716/g.18329 Transcript_6716/m.18329 type:complete len:284 (+) Transcript_6716:88-939(+)